MLGRVRTLLLATLALAGCAHVPGKNSEVQASILCERLAVDAQLAADNPAITDSTFVAACVDAVAPKIGPCMELPRNGPEQKACLDRRAGFVMNELYKSVAGKLVGTLLGNALELEQRTPDERRKRCLNAKGLYAESCAIAKRAVDRPHFESAGALQFVGSSDQTSVRRALEGHVVDLRPCARVHPGIHGKLVLQLTIARYGEVIDALVRDSTLGEPKAERCLVSTVKRWTFEVPPNGGVEVVTWPLATRP